MADAAALEKALRRLYDHAEIPLYNFSGWVWRNGDVSWLDREELHQHHGDGGVISAAEKAGLKVTDKNVIEEVMRATGAVRLSDWAASDMSIHMEVPPTAAQMRTLGELADDYEWDDAVVAGTGKDLGVFIEPFTRRALREAVAKLTFFTRSP